MRTIAFVNKNGGVGKTRSAVEVAYILATIYQQRVLLADAELARKEGLVHERA